MEDSSPDTCEMHVIVKGRVQGVGFRATTRYQALQLGLRGTVRNLSDGSVEIYAQGSKHRLEELRKRLKQEFGLEQVEEALIEYFPIHKPHQDFRIIY